MFKKYSPIKLHKAKEEILKKHPKGKYGRIMPIGDRLRELIEKITSLKQEDVEVIAVGLSDDSVASVVSYIPLNYYNKDLTNLFEVLKYRNNEEMSKILFLSWQNAYTNRDCNVKLYNLYKTDKHFSNVFKGTPASSVFPEMLANEDPLIVLIQALKKNSSTSGSLVEKLSLYGIVENTELFIAVQKLFYIFCSRDDYLHSNVADILASVKQYNNNQLKEFFKNFLPKIDYSDFRHFNMLAVHFSNGISKYSEKYSIIFKGFSQDLINKYTSFINVYKIEDFFKQNPDRGDFWKRYIVQDVIVYRKAAAIVFEFKNVFASDFLSESGALYFYDKETFKSIVQREFRSSEEGELKSWLYNNQEYTMWRKMHSGNWQRDVHNFIVRRDLAEIMIKHRNH